jgi:hypothetical protein
VVFVVLASQWKLCRCEEEFWTVKKFGLFFFKDVVLGFFFPASSSLLWHHFFFFTAYSAGELGCSRCC